MPQAGTETPPLHLFLRAHRCTHAHTHTGAHTHTRAFASRAKAIFLCYETPSYDFDGKRCILMTRTTTPFQLRAGILESVAAKLQITSEHTRAPSQVTGGRGK